MFRQLARSVRVAGHILTGLLICMLWLAPLAALQRNGSRNHRARIISSWMRKLLAMLSARVVLYGQPAPGPVLLVANHVSWLDIPCVLGSVEAIFVAKDDVARWPVIGWLASAVGTIYLERGFGTTEALARMVAALRDGERVMIFPEGTSTDGATVRMFHARLYQAAIETGAPVQAVAIRYPAPPDRPSKVPFVGDDSFIDHLWRLLKEPVIEAELRFLPPCQSVSQTRRALASLTQQQIANVLRRPSTSATTTTSDFRDEVITRRLA